MRRDRDFYDEDKRRRGGDEPIFGRLIESVDQKRYAVSKMNKARLVIGFSIVLILFVVLIFRVAKWQIVEADELKEKATSIQTLDADINSTRGTIYDANGNELAKSITKYELYAYTNYLYKNKDLSGAEKDAVVKNAAKITGKSEEDIKKLLSGDENPVMLASGLSEKAVSQAKKLWGDKVFVRTKVSRHYTNGAFAAHVLGGVNENGIGRTGLEYQYNGVLAGVNGRVVKQTDNNGQTISSGKSKLFKAQDGNNIVTSLDSVIQYYVEDAIEKGMKETGAESICCIVTDPKTGNVLAIAQTPEYNPNNSTQPSDPEELAKYKKLSVEEQSAYLSNMWKIDAINNRYEPGSTFKLIAAATALETGAANDNSSYYCNGTINVDGITLHCLGHHGTQNLKQAVGNSCNPALARVAFDIGAKTYIRYIKLFGFGDVTGIDLPGEAGSIIKDPNTMGSVDLATMGYGHGISITPIQILTAVNALGNDGILMKPKIVQEITDKNGKTIESFKDTEVRQVISKETADKMRDYMEYYVSSAGGTAAYISGYRIGGKTGTANIASEGSYSSLTDTSFVAMAPMDDPVISMIVIVHKPTKKQYGNNTAGPIIKDIMEKSLPYLGVEKKYTESEASSVKESQTTVPNVTGMDSEKAISAIKGVGLNYEIMPKNNSKKSFVVQDQYPKAGSKLKKGGKVYIYSK